MKLAVKAWMVIAKRAIRKAAIYAARMMRMTEEAFMMV